MAPSRPYLIIADSVLPDNLIGNLFDQFTLQLASGDGCPTGAQIGWAFSALLTFVRESYKANFQEREKDFALTEQDLKNQLTATQIQLAATQTHLAATTNQYENQIATAKIQLETQLAASDVRLRQLEIDKRRVESDKRRVESDKRRVEGVLDLKKSYSERLQKELAEARRAKTEFEMLSNAANIKYEASATMLERTATQLENQSKVVDRLLLNGMSRMSKEADPLCGSISKSVLWQAQQNISGNHFSIPLRELGLALHSDPQAIREKCKTLLSTKYPKEPPMYEPFVEFLEDYLSDTEFLVFNTSQCYYLDGLAPDITISLPGVTAADAMAMVLFVELKAQDRSVLGNDHNLGQVYEYLLAAARCQRERSKFAGILSNFRQNIAIVLTRTRDRAYLTHYIGTNMETILRFVTGVLGDRDHHPPDLGFSTEIGPMLSRLGQVSNSIVGQFALLERFPASVNIPPVVIPNELVTEPARMAVKRPKYFTPGLINVEVNVLLRIRQGGMHPNLPHIVMLSDDQSEFGILPIGAPISPATLCATGIGSTIIDNILDALKHLHSYGIIHRDVRTANVVLHGRKAVLIDFDAATQAGILTTHMGGFICTPQAVLRNPGEKYIPKPADDYLAVVLMVNSLLFPSAYRGFKSMKLTVPGSDEHDRIMALWRALRASAIWGPLVAAAEDERPDMLRAGLKALVVTL